MKKVLMYTAAALLAGASVLSAAAEDTLRSAPVFVYLQPGRNSLWSTMPGNSVSLPITFPNSATSATLSIASKRGKSYSPHVITAEDLTADGLYELEFPAPASPAEEDVLVFTLAFNDPLHTVRTAELSLICGLRSDNSGVTRCLTQKGTARWNRLPSGGAVLPIPYGTTSFLVDDVETDTGLDGAQGWYFLPYRDNVQLSLTEHGSVYLASLRGAVGSVLFFQ